jgi:hypothetical protein
MSGGDHRWFERSTRKKEPATRDDNNSNNNNNNRNKGTIRNRLRYKVGY